MAECVVLVRQALPEDEAARVALVRQGLAEYNFPAFFYFFLQEWMLQCVLLCCAVLFIFFNTPLWVCVLPGPVFAVATYIACTCVHMELTNTHKQKVREECVGFVAELRGPLVTCPEGVMPRVLRHDESAPVSRSRVLGTVSVSGGGATGEAAWLHDLTVAVGWRGRGLGGALAEAAAGWAAGRGAALGATVSVLQGAAGSVLQGRGWRTQGSYSRPAPPPAPALARLPVLRLVLYPPDTSL